MSLHVPTMAEMMAKGESPEILFWVDLSDAKLKMTIFHKSAEESGEN